MGDVMYDAMPLSKANNGSLIIVIQSARDLKKISFIHLFIGILHAFLFVYGIINTHQHLPTSSTICYLLINPHPSSDSGRLVVWAHRLA